MRMATSGRADGSRTAVEGLMLEVEKADVAG